MVVLIAGLGMVAVGAAFAIFNSYGNESDEDDAEAHFEMKQKGVHNRGTLRPPMGSPRRHKAFSPKGHNQFNGNDLEHGYVGNNYVEYDYARDANLANFPREHRHSRHGSFRHERHNSLPERRSRSNSRSRRGLHDPAQHGHLNGHSERRSRSRSHSRSRIDLELERQSHNHIQSRREQLPQYAHHDPRDEYYMNGEYDRLQHHAQQHRSGRNMGSSRNVEENYYVRQ